MKEKTVPPEKDTYTQLYDILNRMLLPYGKSFQRPNPQNALAIVTPPVDISRPNEHDSKGAFQLEYDTVSSACDLLSQLIDLLIPSDERDDLRETQSRLGGVLSQKLYANSPRSGMHDGYTMIRKMVAEAGGYTASALMLLDLRAAMIDRLVELSDQKEKFWNLPYRAPDFYARAIALRLAKFFCQNVGQKPGYGTSGITGEDSTAYSRALKELFDLLGISGNTRTYGEWAVDQLTETDLLPHRNALISALMGHSVTETDDENLRTLTRRASQKGADP